MLQGIYSTPEAEDLISRLNRYDRLTRGLNDEQKKIKDNYAQSLLNDGDIDAAIEKIETYNTEAYDKMYGAFEDGLLLNVHDTDDLKKLMSKYEITQKELKNAVKKAVE